MKKRPTLLIIRTSALGDVAMTIPAVYSLARKYPEWDVKVLTRAPFAALFLHHPDNVSVIPADLKGRHKGFRGLLRLLGDLRKEHIGRVADFHDIFRSRLIDAFFRLCGKRVRVVRKARRQRRKLTRRQNKDLTPQRNFVLRYVDVLHRLGFAVTPDFTSLFASGGERPPLPDWIPDKGVERWVGIAPFARYETKTYPLESMEQLVRRLSADGFRIFLFGGGKREAAVLGAWENACPMTHALPGKLTMPQELSLMSRLDAMVSMDSANMHMASLAGATVVSVWGSTTPACGFLGWGQREENAVCLHLPCQPCTIAGSPACPLGHFDCMKRLDFELLYRRILFITQSL